MALRGCLLLHVKVERSFSFLHFFRLLRLTEGDVAPLVSSFDVFADETFCPRAYPHQYIWIGVVTGPVFGTIGNIGENDPTQEFDVVSVGLELWQSKASCTLESTSYGPQVFSSWCPVRQSDQQDTRPRHTSLLSALMILTGSVTGAIPRKRQPN